MATAKTQRIAIFVIMIVMVVGTLGSFFVIILQNENQKADSKRQQVAVAKYQEDLAAHQRQIDAQTSELSKKYYPELSKYQDSPAKFDRDGVDKIVKKDLKVGSGATIGDDTKFAAYYIGWNPDGEVFDQSIEEATKSLKIPLYYSDVNSGSVGLEEGLKNASLIEGWKDGMKGMKIGGVRLLTIPSDVAYGEQGSGDMIPANTPIKFIVMAIPALKDIKQPEIPQELLKGL